MAFSPDSKVKLWQRISRFDGAILLTSLFLFLVLGVLLLGGDRTTLRVESFSWEGRQVGVSDRYFTLNFSHRPDPDSVIQHLSVEPPLPGKASWKGRSLVYTLSEPPIYGTNYQLKLDRAKRSYDGNEIAPFTGVFSTRDRTLAYIGVSNEEAGRLILKNITDINQPQKTILTPRDLVVTQFQIYPDSSKILFLAFDPSSSQGYTQQHLFTVSTGIDPDGDRAGRINAVLPDKNYFTQAFQLSADGSTVVALRTNRNNPADSSLWVIPERGKPRPLGIPAEEFVVAPDGSRAIVSQKGGVAVIPLKASSGSFQFLPGFEKSLGFTPDGKSLLLVRNNPDYSRSLVLQQPDGSDRELFKTANPIVDCQFEPRSARFLYCLKVGTAPQAKAEGTQPATGQDPNQVMPTYREEPYLSAIDLATVTEFPLLALPNYRDVHLSMSPDGVALLFDQVVTVPPTAPNNLVNRSGESVIDGRVWLFSLPNLETSEKSVKVLPQELNAGFNPQWLP